jgi:hypothetical protein
MAQSPALIGFGSVWALLAVGVFDAGAMMTSRAPDHGGSGLDLERPVGTYN